MPIIGGPAIRSASALFAEGGGNGAWAAEQFMKNGLTVNSLRTNDVLRKDEWLRLDEAVLKEALGRLTGVSDLISRGLTMDLPNAMGTTIVEWEQESFMDPATRSMEGVTPAQRDRVDYTLVGIPVHITHKDFQISLRVLESSRTRGMPLDTTQAEIATRVVIESLEDALFNGVGITVGTRSAPGYTTHANRNTGTISTGWATATGAQILADVIAMIAALQADRMYGPYILYVNGTYWTELMDDFKAESDKTIMQRLRELDGIEDIKVSDDLSATEVVMVQMTKDVVDLVDGESPQTVQWDTVGGFMLNFKVLAIQVPRVKVTAAGRSGIAHWSE